MKKIVLVFVLLFSIIINAQEDKTVTLTVSGTGKNLEEAKTNALRSAIEQAFGAFISSKTEILNDNLVKDEVVSVANGNIQKFDIISEIQIPDGSYATSIKAAVSINKLTSFVESKGVIVEFKGGLFASNVLIQELYEKNEIKAIENVIITLDAIAKKSFEYTISAEEPSIAYDDKWKIPITIIVKANGNFINISNLFEQTLQSLTLSESDLNNYIKLNKKIYPVTLSTINDSKVYYLRNNLSRKKILEFIYSFSNIISNIKISNGLTIKRLEEYNIEFKYDDKEGNIRNIKNLTLEDTNFLLYIRGGSGALGPNSIFNDNNHFNDRSNRFNGSFVDNFNYKWVDFNHKYLFEMILQSYSGFDFTYGANYEDNIYHYFDKKYWGKEYPDYMKNFYSLKKVLIAKKEGVNFGLVISFSNISSVSKLIEFKFNETKTLDEIKQITKYEIIKN